MSGSVTHTGEHETCPACIANAKKDFAVDCQSHGTASRLSGEKGSRRAE